MGKKKISGTKLYLAPEVLGTKGLRRNKYLDFPRDVWSAGVMAYFMLEGEGPWTREDVGEAHFDQSFVLKALNKPTFETPKLSSEGQSLLGRLLDVDFTKRITA